MAKLSKHFFDILKPRRYALLWLIAIPIAAAGILTKSIAVRDDRGVKGELYVFGKKGDPKMAVITNKKPMDAIKECIKRSF